MAVPKACVLVVDDDVALVQAVTEALSAHGYSCQTAYDGLQALDRVNAAEPDLILTDLNMPRMDGSELIAELQQRDVRAPIIVLTGYGSLEKAVSVVLDLKAFWFLEKPVPVTAMLPLIERALAHRNLRREMERLSGELALHGFLGQMVGTSAAMQQAFFLIRQVAPSSAPVLITGESGTGKEMVAREIHRLSSHAAGPFVAVNCAALPETLIESELFGHEKGAFTGALERRVGSFEQAGGGTLLLDEIGEMPVGTQAKLLRVLEDMRVRRLGAKTEVQVNCRVIAATNRPPETAILQGTLREDLYYRLNVFRIHLPPLRDRRSDLPAIAQGMIHGLNRKHGTRVTHLQPSALQRLEAHTWPGNVRELRNVVERAVILAQEGPIETFHLRLEAPVPADSASAPQTPLAGEGRLLTFEPGLPLARIEETYIEATLKLLGYNRRATAAALGISLRTLQTRIGEIRQHARTSEAAATAG